MRAGKKKRDSTHPGLGHLSSACKLTKGISVAKWEQILLHSNPIFIMQYVVIII